MAVPAVQTFSPTEREAAYQRNFWLFLFDSIFFTVAMSLIGTTTVIPDFIRRLTDSEVLIGLSSSLFEIGWMLPQLFMARYLVKVASKKWWFAGPNIVVRFAIPIFAVLIFLLGNEQPGLLLGAFLICYGIAAWAMAWSACRGSTWSAAAWTTGAGRGCSAS
jgi:hypothetical protein